MALRALRARLAAAFDFVSFSGSRACGSVAPLKDTLVNESQFVEYDEKRSKSIIDTVKSLVVENSSRIFAVIYVAGKQRRVTEGDLIRVDDRWPPTLGDEVNFEKVLLAGTREFSLIGRPLVQPGLVRVKGTVVGKNLTVTKVNFKKKPRKQYMRIHFFRPYQTVVRINEIKIGPNLNEPCS